MSRGSASPQRELWASSHITPTVADIELAPRRRLRDGSEAGTGTSSSSSRPRSRGHGSSRRSKTPSGASGVLGKRGRFGHSQDSESHSGRSGSTPSRTDTPPDPDEATTSRHPNTTNNDTNPTFPTVPSDSSSTMNGDSTRLQLQNGAEASRRLPRLHPRVRQLDSSDLGLGTSGEDEDDGDAGSEEGSEEYNLPDPTPGPSSGRIVQPIERPTNSPVFTSNAPFTIFNVSDSSDDDDDDDVPPARDMAARRDSRDSNGRSSPSKRPPRAAASATAADASTLNGASGSGSASVSPRRRQPIARARTNSTEPEERRFTTAEKGKGRARPPSPTATAGTDSDIDLNLDAADASMDDGIQFVAAAPAPEVVTLDEPTTVIDEDSALSAYTCPVCFCAPTNPAFTPCGHVLCYGCLHSSLLAAIQRQVNPWPPMQANRRGRGRGRGRPPSIPVVQPTAWDNNTIQAAAEADRAARVAREVEGSNMAAGDMPAAIAAATEEEVQIERPLNHLWKVDGQWVIEGECPVCRKAIPGGLGPLGSGIGGVTVIETRVAY